MFKKLDRPVERILSVSDFLLVLNFARLSKRCDLLTRSIPCRLRARSSHKSDAKVGFLCKDTFLLPRRESFVCLETSYAPERVHTFS